MKKLINLSNDQSYLWQSLLKETIKIATSVEFNVLYDSKEVKSFIEEHFSDFLGENLNNNNKFYNSGKSIRFGISDLMRIFLEDKDFSFWENKPLEDPSFYYNSEEILATITHENVLVLNIDSYNHISNLLANIDMYDIANDK